MQVVAFIFFLLLHGSGFAWSRNNNKPLALRSYKIVVFYNIFFPSSFSLRDISCAQSYITKSHRLLDFGLLPTPGILQHLYFFFIRVLGSI